MYKRQIKEDEKQAITEKLARQILNTNRGVALAI